VLWLDVPANHLDGDGLAGLRDRLRLQETLDVAVIS
jgi:ATPase subunit of ABC transporter with duplicated ATPase domains